jgi:hypothetical protein
MGGPPAANHSRAGVTSQVYNEIYYRFFLVGDKIPLQNVIKADMSVAIFTAVPRLGSQGAFVKVRERVRQHSPFILIILVLRSTEPRDCGENENYYEERGM